MLSTIVKRDGRQVPFDQNKIALAIQKAFQASRLTREYETCMELAASVIKKAETTLSAGPSVEQIQDLVEGVLIENGYIHTAKAYILYRAERTRSRDMQTRLMKIYEDITFSKAADSDLKRENANINGDSAMGMMLKYGSEGVKQFYDMFVLKPEHAAAHREGDIHIHDLDFLTLTTTCCQIDILKLFHGGFGTGHGTLREPQDIASYSALACIAIQANQNDQHGGQSIVNFDYGLAPGVAKTYAKRYRQNMVRAMELLTGAGRDWAALLSETTNELAEQGLQPLLEDGEAFHAAEIQALLPYADLDTIVRAQGFSLEHARQETDRATFQAMEALVHNLNTMHSRAGAQIPFSSINYGMDTSPEGRMVIKNVLLAQEEGLGEGETPIFPIHIFRVKDGINYEPGEPNYDLFKLACRVSARRLFPNFSFQDAPFNLQYYKPGQPETEIAYMGCRTRVIGNSFDPSREISPGRGNLSFTSINLPRLAIKAKGDITAFFEDLDRRIDLVVDQLEERFEMVAGKTMRNFPFLMGEGVWIDSEKLGVDEPIREVLKHGTFSIGFIGLAEALTGLVGQHHGQSEVAQNLGLDIIAHMRARVDEISRQKQLNFTLLATPAEGLSGTFIRKDKARFGIIPGITDKEYYTNSFHIPVGFPIAAFQKIKLEAPYHELTNAGHITYVEMDGDPTQNLEAFEQVIRCMHDSGIGYGSINHPVDRDPLCGFTGIIGDACPKCGRGETPQHPFERIRRVTGYLVGSLGQWNDAKRAEERDRIKHGI
ncbi:MAG: anaerobic ribonucleoside triphosphate reductase [Christensenellaceae bacterium]|jgi:ribonucleoside-triphosphate reductase|nr:anaerobic ribonucleoside triphosphate reductase [Christensenellaceae bacterium]